MSLSINLEQNLLKVIQKNKDLFALFDEVYLFGSSIIEGKQPNDVDVLLVYSRRDSSEVANSTKHVLNSLENECEIPFDLTIMSQSELHSTRFLHAIKTYKRII